MPNDPSIPRAPDKSIISGTAYNRLADFIGNNIPIGRQGLNDGIPPRRMVQVKVTGIATDGGCYVGKVLQPPLVLKSDGTGDLAESDLGDAPSLNDALILNRREAGKSTHNIPVPCVLDGILLGVNSD